MFGGDKLVSIWGFNSRSCVWKENFQRINIRFSWKKKWIC